MSQALALTILVGISSWFVISAALTYIICRVLNRRRHEDSVPLYFCDCAECRKDRQPLTAAEAQALCHFVSYGATRGNHSDDGRGPTPGPLTPFISDALSGVRKLWPLAEAKCAVRDCTNPRAEGCGPFCLQHD